MPECPTPFVKVDDCGPETQHPGELCCLITNDTANNGTKTGVPRCNETDESNENRTNGKQPMDTNEKTNTNMTGNNIDDLEGVRDNLAYISLLNEIADLTDDTGSGNAKWNTQFIIEKDGTIGRTSNKKGSSNEANERNNRDNANVDVDDYNRNNQEVRQPSTKPRHKRR